MNELLQLRIEQTTALRNSRAATAQLVFNNQNLFPVLLNFALNSNYKHQHKACWILEWVFDQQPLWFNNYFSEIFSAIAKIKHPGALRSISRITMILITSGHLVFIENKVKNSVHETLIK